jgi:hypothetical protein
VRFTHLVSNLMVCSGVGQCDKQSSNSTAGIHRVELRVMASHGPASRSARFLHGLGRQVGIGEKFLGARAGRTLPGLESTEVSAACSGTSKGKPLAIRAPSISVVTIHSISTPLRLPLQHRTAFSSASSTLPPASGLRTRLTPPLWRHGPVLRPTN